MSTVSTGASVAPQSSIKTTLWYSATKYGEKTQIGYVQSIPTMTSPKEGISWGALDDDEEHMAKGRRKAESKEIVILYTEQQYKALKVIANSDSSYWFFIKYPESTKDQETDSLVMSVSASMDLAHNEIAIDDMLQDTMTLYTDSKVEESYGFPTQPSSGS